MLVINIFLWIYATHKTNILSRADHHYNFLCRLLLLHVLQVYLCIKCVKYTTIAQLFFEIDTAYTVKSL